MENLFKEKSQYIKIYLGTETEIDPFEKNISVSLLNPTPIRAIVTDLTSAKVQWAMPGIVTDKAKEIIIRKKNRPMLEMSRKIQILGDNDYYEGWKTNGKMQIREEGEYIRCYIYIRKSNE